MLKAIAAAVLRLDLWLDTMRQAGGYGGPVAHWWRDCLAYTGPGLDWRYEGIVAGYLNLWQATRDGQWLAKAMAAGDDLVCGQLPSGNYHNSCFEANPNSGGTPHEAACDLALLRLAEALKGQQDERWMPYAQAAARNLRQYHVARLVDPAARTVRDDIRVPSFVPNKAATIAEAFLLLARLEEDPAWAEVYALPILDRIVACQAAGGRLDGGIYQNRLRDQTVPKFFPYYIARCIPGLLAGYEWNREARYLEAAERAAAFIVRHRYDDGSYPQVIYENGRTNRYPQWIAGVGDILRCLDLAAAHGFAWDRSPSLEWLLNGQLPTGAFRTARGFACQVDQRRPAGDPDFRDLLGVCGWNDKAFRYLTGLLAGECRLEAADYPAAAVRIPCRFRNLRAVLVEDTATLELRHEGQLIYRWEKSAAWAQIPSPGSFW